MYLIISNVKISGPNRRYVLDQLQEYADHFSDRRVSSVELIKVDGRECAINVYDVHGRLDQQRVFDSQDLMVGFILGANQYLDAHQVIKELHK